MSVLTLVLIILGFIAALGDLYTTYKFLQVGVTEANPLAAWLFKKIGFIGVIPLKLFPFGLLGYVYHSHGASTALTVIAAGLLALNSYAVYHNKKILDKR